MTRRENGPPRKLPRRKFAAALTGGALGVACGAEDGPSETTSPLEPARSLLPPSNAVVQTTACAYCAVGCGYKAYSWPTADEPGAAAAGENALGIDYPTPVLSGGWISPQMHSVVLRDGEPHHLVVVPDRDTQVVNVGGDHGMGASLARKLYSPVRKSDRLRMPQLRVGKELVPISWDEATQLIAGISQYVLEQEGPLAWGMKTYSYQFYENTYAITKFAFEGIKTPCWAPHDKPRDASDAPGLSDAGVDAFSAAYKDWKNSDVLFLSGVALYEARPVLFSQWVMGGPQLIVVNPRRDAAADYALEQGGLFLQVRPGTDTVLHNAIAREILVNGWEDTGFIQQSCAQAEDFADTIAGKWRRERFGLTPEAYRDFIVDTKLHRLAEAAEHTGVAAELISEAARRLAKPIGGKRVKASFMLEKGNYWSHNYTNTASLVSLGLLTGAGNRPGQVISRGGGHQRGMAKGADYPLDLSPHTVAGQPAAVNLDHWALEGKLRFAWVIGCTWAGGGTAAAAPLYQALETQCARGTDAAPDLPTLFPDGEDGGLDVDRALAFYRARVDAGGLVMVHQDLYPQPFGELCDLLLPAAGWGEAPFSRMQGERRLRHYPKLADAPGEALADWRIIQRVAQQMGLSGYDWEDENAIFEEASAKSGGANDYGQLVQWARSEGLAATQVLSDMGTTGIQCPVRLVDGELLGTERLHEEGFGTPTGKALFVRGAWDDAEALQAASTPRGDELWVINRRSSGTWSSMVEDLRNPYRASLWSENWVEVNPEDATVRGIEDGKAVRLRARGVLASGETNRSTWVAGVARITDRTAPGVCCLYFNYSGDPKLSANSLVSNEEDALNGLFAFKLARATLEAT